MLAWVTSKLGFSEVDGFLLHGWGLNEQSQRGRKDKEIMQKKKKKRV
jgi:hypothetical protein